LELIFENPVPKKVFIPNHTRGSKIFVSDSSDVKACTYEFSEDMKLIDAYNFKYEERSTSNLHRELLALIMTFGQFKDQGNFRLKNICNIYWYNDSEKVVRFLEKGSRNHSLQKMIFEIATTAQDLQI